MGLRPIPRERVKAAAAVVAVCVALVGAGCAHRTQQPVVAVSAQQRTAPIQVAITAADAPENSMILKLTNVSGRPIVAWDYRIYSNRALTVGGGEDLYNSDRRFVAEGETSLTLSGIETPTVVVSAVFDDRTGAGDEAGVQMIFTRRREIRDAYSAWVTEFKSDVSRGPAGMDALRARVQQFDEARRWPIGIAGVNHDAAAVFSSNTPAAEIPVKLGQILQRAEKQLSLAEVASSRR